MNNREWIASGKTGCTFATLFAKNPTSVGWQFISHDMYKYVLDSLDANNCLLLSITFPKICTYKDVRYWAINNGFYTEDTSDTTEGLRIKCKEGISWVQYFGPDSHVVTRRTPYPMLTYTRRLNTSHYIKVGFKGVLHLAHAYSSRITERVYDLLWNRSYKQTKKKLGHEPTIIEAAKTTFLK